MARKMTYVDGVRETIQQTKAWGLGDKCVSGEANQADEGIAGPGVINQNKICVKTP